MEGVWLNIHYSAQNAALFVDLLKNIFFPNNKEKQLNAVLQNCFIFSFVSRMIGNITLFF